MCAEIIHSADLRLHVFVCRVHFFVLHANTRAIHQPVHFFTYKLKERCTKEKEREREKAKRLPLCRAGVVRAFAVGAHRRDHHVRQ